MKRESVTGTNLVKIALIYFVALAISFVSFDAKAEGEWKEYVAGGLLITAGVIIIHNADKKNNHDGSGYNGHGYGYRSPANDAFGGSGTTPDPSCPKNLPYRDPHWGCVGSPTSN